jgi:hypothetical protein
MNDKTMIAAAVGIIAISAISAYSFISTGNELNKADINDKKETTRDSLFVLREEEEVVPENPIHAEPKKFDLPEFNKNNEKHKIISIKKDRRPEQEGGKSKSKKRRKYRKKTKRKKN